jgi:hypothetical protein
LTGSRKTETIHLLPVFVRRYLPDNRNNGMTNRFTMAPSTEAIRRSGRPAIATLVATAALTALIAGPGADAATRKTPRPERTTEAVAPRNAGEPIMAIVSIKSQKVTFYDADGWILRARNARGRLQRGGEGQGPPLEHV